MRNDRCTEAKEYWREVVKERRARVRKENAELKIRVQKLVEYCEYLDKELQELRRDNQ